MKTDDNGNSKKQLAPQYLKNVFWKVVTEVDLCNMDSVVRPIRSLSKVDLNIQWQWKAWTPMGHHKRSTGRAQEIEIKFVQDLKWPGPLCTKSTQELQNEWPSGIKMSTAQSQSRQVYFSCFWSNLDVLSLLAVLDLKKIGLKDTFKSFSVYYCISSDNGFECREEPDIKLNKFGISKKRKHPWQVSSQDCYWSA